MKDIRLRFAPSPTGALHIGGVRTALYNYLLARKHRGALILRIEDTDQARYVPGAEDYILEAMKWCGLEPDEGPGFGGEYGPYRQSERKSLYRRYAQQLLESGRAYYAFDTPEELEARRQAEEEAGNSYFKYDARTRTSMKNSLTLTEEAVKDRLASGENYTVRIKVPEGETITIQDRIRGEVTFDTSELDDKVVLKADGLPTYHLANIVDDHLMEVTHVVRGEEWLPSTAHHVLLYRFLGWEREMPEFAHLPLILKPSGKGKLSKRDGAKLGIPVFPLDWKDAGGDEHFTGFREFGFDPRAVINFLAFLGWNPGTEQEIFSMEELIEAFSLEKISKGGARFDFDKARWFNQQYIIASDDAYLAQQVRPLVEAHGHQPSDAYLKQFCALMKERVMLFTEFWEKGKFFFETPEIVDAKPVRKKWQPQRRHLFDALNTQIRELEKYQAAEIKAAVEHFMRDNALKPGEVLPVLRVGVSGTTKGPALFEMMELLGKAITTQRLERAFDRFDEMAAETNQN